MLAKKKADKQLQTFLDGLKPQQQGKGIKDYMIMPVQRIPRYEMLLIVSLFSQLFRFLFGKWGLVNYNITIFEIFIFSILRFIFFWF